MEVLTEPIVIDGELPFRIIQKKGGYIDRPICSSNYMDISIILFIIILIMIIIWKFVNSYTIKVDKVDIR